MAVRREGGKFVLRSKKGRVLGRSRTKKGIRKRERQVQFFKNKDRRGRRRSSRGRRR